MRRFEKKQNRAKANLLVEQRYLQSKGLIKEEYDLVNSFNGQHNTGTPFPEGKNEPWSRFLNSVAYDEDGIKQLQTWINIMIEDKDWLRKKYPNGMNLTTFIKDIDSKVNGLKDFIKNNQSVNPIKIINALKKILLT
jgi:hypothetical protein